MGTIHAFIIDTKFGTIIGITHGTDNADARAKARKAWGERVDIALELTDDQLAVHTMKGGIPVFIVS